MNKCPKCGAEIDMLISISEESKLVSFKFKLEGNEISYSNRKEEIMDEQTFHCPECNGEFVYSEEEAVKFLKEK